MADTDDAKHALDAVIRELAKDSEFTKPQWKHGAEEIWSHFTDKAKRAMGGFVLGAIGVAVIAKVITWAVQVGVFK
jgi:hypothetical protein